MNDTLWDKYLKIQTTGRQDAHADEFHYPYEPTPYSVLERLAKSDYIDCNSKVIDYGCGKGRVGFYLNHKVGCETIGIEYNEQIYKKAIENQKTFSESFKIGGSKKSADNQRVEFICTNAENYKVEDANCFYFFNPFSIELLRSVLGKIIDSYYDNPRVMTLFFYYPNEEYLAFLMTEEHLMFTDEIDCQDLFPGNNQRERILIFEIV